MSFPTRAQFDAMAMAAMAIEDDGEGAAIHRTRDGVETPCVVWLDDVSVESYSDSGVVVSSPQQQIRIQRAHVERPEEHETVQIGTKTYRLLQMAPDSDSGSTVWSVVGVRGTGT